MCKDDIEMTGSFAVQKHDSDDSRREFIGDYQKLAKRVTGVDTPCPECSGKFGDHEKNCSYLHRCHECYGALPHHNPTCMFWRSTA